MNDSKLHQYVCAMKFKSYFCFRIFNSNKEKEISSVKLFLKEVFGYYFLF